MSQQFDQQTKAGTLGGTLLTIVANIQTDDLIKTGILAAVGAVISFVVTLFLKFLIKWFRR